MFFRNPIYPLRLDEELFPHISVISGHQNHISRPMSNIFKLKELNRQEKISFGDIPSHPKHPISNTFVRKILRENRLSRQKPVFFGTIPSPNILDLIIMLNKMFLYPTAE